MLCHFIFFSCLHANHWYVEHRQDSKLLETEWVRNGWGSSHLVTVWGDLVWVPLQTITGKRQKAGTRSCSAGQSGIRIQMPVLSCGREKSEAGCGIAHKKSFKSSEALGAVMCRAVNWSWHSSAGKRKKNSKCTSVSEAPKKKKNPTKKPSKTRQWFQRAGEKKDTHRPHCWKGELKCLCLYIYRHPHKPERQHTPHPRIFSKKCGHFLMTEYTYLATHVLYWIATFSRLNNFTLKWIPLSQSMQVLYSIS